MPYWRLYYHLVWSTKQREPALDSAKVESIRRMFWSAAKQMDLQIHALSVQPDHVHIAFSAPPRHSIAEIARKLKGGSSHYLAKQYEGDWCGWQPEYGVVSFGQQSLSRVVDYVKNQETHHRAGQLMNEFEKGLDPVSPSGTSSD